MKRMSCGLIALLFAASSQVALAGGATAPSAVVVDKSGNVARAQLGNAAPHLVPVCGPTNLPSEGGVTTGGYQTSTQRLYWCPRGAISIAILFSGVTASPPETNLTSPIPMHIGIWANAPAPWSSAASYSAGQQVIYLGAVWAAAIGNANSTPSPSNAAWTVGTWGPFTRVTCNGFQTCTLDTVTDASGSVATQPILQTDSIPAGIPVGGYIMVKIWTTQSGTQTTPAGQPVNPLLNGYFTQGPALADYSVAQPTANQVLAAQWTPGFGPTAIIGVPVTAGPTACVIGDSIASGNAGNGLQAYGSLTSGGSGYTSADVGLTLTIPNTGAASNAVGNSALITITGVTSGVVTNISLTYGGNYNNPVRNTSGINPSGAQLLVGGHGTGLTVTLPAMQTGYDSGDQYGSLGWIARGLALNSIPAVMVTRPTDTLANWVSRDYSRLQLINASGCSTVVQELAINDQSSSVSVIEGRVLTLGQQLAALPYVRALLQTTMTIDALSTDGYLTTANQTENGGSAGVTLRTTFNAWVVSKPAPFTGYIDGVSLIESAPNSYLWAADGVNGCNGTGLGLTCDGIHPITRGHILMAPAINTAVQAGYFK